MSLFSKIANLKTNYSSQLSISDVDTLNRMFSKHQVLYSEHNEIKETLAEQSKLINVDWMTNRFDAFSKSIIVSSHNGMIGNINEFFKYLNNQYGLNVPSLSTISEETNSRRNRYDEVPVIETLDFKTSEDILQRYFTFGGIVSLNESSINKTKEDFKKTCSSWKPPTRKKKIIAFPNHFSIDEWDFSRQGITKFSHDAVNIFHKMKNALRLFETGNATNDKPDIDCKFNDMTTRYGVEVCLDEQFFGSSSRIESVKFFKNKKVLLKFPTEYLAEEFMIFFELNQLQK